MSTTGLAPDVEHQLRARAAVYHSGRGVLKTLTDLETYTLQGRKTVTDVLVAGYCLPPGQPTAMAAARWLAAEWDKSITATLAYGDPVDDDSPFDWRAVLSTLRSCLPDAAQATDAVRTVFDQICRHCAGAYREAWRQPQLVVQPMNHHPGTGNAVADPYSLTAFTRRDGDGAAVVTVKFFLKEFGPETYAALPRLLVHECFCHAVAGHSHRQADNGSPFAEGWMDWAAELRFTQWLRKSDRTFAPAARHHGDAFTRAAPTRRPEGAARLLGYACAENLRSWFRERGYGETKSRNLTARLALEVNLAGNHLRDKDRLTTAFTDRRLRPELEDALERWAAIPQADPASPADIIKAVRRKR